MIFNLYIKTIFFVKN